MSKRLVDWLKLALRALRGEATYSPPIYGGEDCDCPECSGITKVPWRYRFNQPPFRTAEDDNR